LRPGKEEPHVRALIKKTAFYLVLVPTMVPFLLYRLLALIFGEGVFESFSQLYSLLPGPAGDICRGAFYFLTLKKCSRDTRISFGTFFPTPEVEIGSFVYIGPNCIVSSSIIEDDVMIGSNVQIINGKSTHNFADITTPMRLQGGSRGTVRIGQDTWVGNCSIVMADLGQKCVVGAGSVVAADVAEYSVVVGNPARVVRKRI
jgi:virginiamycin A acetyltransferase